MTQELRRPQTLARPREDLLAVAISGSPRAPSKSKTLAERALSDLASQGCETKLIDVAGLPADALIARSEAREVADAIETVGQAKIVITASPTYRALYTGVLKCLFDLMPQAHLAGKICIGLQTGIAPEHALSPEYGLRPLFVSLGGIPAGVLYAIDGEFAEGQPSADLLHRVQELTRAALAAARSSA